MNVTPRMVSLADVASVAAKREHFVRTHSGSVQPGDIFVSLPRAVPLGPDGLDFSSAAKFLQDAIHRGAAYIVCPECVFTETLPFLGDMPLAVAFAQDTRAALGILAASAYGTGDSSLSLLAVTGTNGKTTSTYLLEAVLRAAGLVPGIIGTVEYRWPGHEEPSPLTTPGALELHSMLAAMRKAGADAAVMEVSSHAIEQNRIASLAFNGALFTNLTQDHLDYHHDMETYFEIKARLFSRPEQGGIMPGGAALAVNADDPYGARLLSANTDILGYGFNSNEGVALRGVILAHGRDGLHLRMTYEGRTWDIRSPLAGDFNAYNLLGVQALALAMGIDASYLQALSSVSGVPGRLERIANDRGLSVFVDYAHTPDALIKAQQALRGAGFTRIITVFGCGGDRDRSKRPRMGEAAASLSDVVVLTSDNPRREDPARIMDDVRPGLAGARRVIEDVDRKKAIYLALEETQPGDALLVAGKGHEPYQIIGDVKYPFSDQQVIREYLGCA